MIDDLKPNTQYEFTVKVVKVSFSVSLQYERFIVIVIFKLVSC